ncbi:MAG TPA: DUF2520 domain-containing protein [Bacteroidaceae bacterium]|nr:DUF2520 domain-containing protein [Bacteroidaceae bacterium]
MRVVLVGAGNVGTRLSEALLSAGHSILAVYSRTELSARTLAENLNVPYTTLLEQLPCDADLYIAALKDDALVHLSKEIVKGREKSLFIHTSGTLNMDIWKSTGATRFGVMYPLQTFSKDKLVDWRSVPIFIEGSLEQEKNLIENFALGLSDNVKQLDSTERGLLHVAAVFACNFSNHMYSISKNILSELKIPFSVLLPLIEETAHKVTILDPHKAQTGPAVRGDKEVLDKHMEFLSCYPELAEIYSIISKNIQNSKK